MSSFQKDTPLELRTAEAKRILDKHPTKVPVICERSARSDLPVLTRKKFLVPGTMLCGEFKYVVHKDLSSANGALSSDQTIYLFVGSTTPKTGAMMSEIYDQHKDSDGFLYVSYTTENTLGWHACGTASASRC